MHNFLCLVKKEIQLIKRITQKIGHLIREKWLIFGSNNVRRSA